LELNRPSAQQEIGLGPSIVRATREWIQYGVFGFAVLCIVIGAVEALFGR